MCELLKARELRDESMKDKALKEIKNSISKEATRFSGYQQHVTKTKHKTLKNLFLFLETKTTNFISKY